MPCSSLYYKNCTVSGIEISDTNNDKFSDLFIWIFCGFPPPHLIPIMHLSQFHNNYFLYLCLKGFQSLKLDVRLQTSLSRWVCNLWRPLRNYEMAPVRNQVLTFGLTVAFHSCHAYQVLYDIMSGMSGRCLQDQ